jgi:MFS family permease
MNRAITHGAGGPIEYPYRREFRDDAPSPVVSAPPTPARTKLLIAALTVLVAGVALCVDRTRNGDLYLQLFTGRFITEHGFVTHDPFPTIGHGRPWLNQQWLSELGFYTAGRWIGITGLTILYAGLLAAPLAIVLFSIRRKGAAMLIATSALYIPGLLAIVHPRAAGFTLLAFCVLVGILLAVLLPRAGIAAGRLRWALIGIPLLFGLWANLHAGFIAGLLLIGLTTVGLTADRWRGIPDAIARHRVAVLAAAGLLAAITVTFATPLEGAIWSYVVSFRNPAIALATTEWEPATQSTPAMAYLAIVSGFAVWMWWRSPTPRRLMPALVVGGFVAFAAFSMRNMIFVAPALAFLIACTTPDRSGPQPRIPIAAAAVAAVASMLTYLAVLGPARSDGPGYAVARYAVRHPPKNGRIAAYAGASSYVLWRSPGTPVVINGWLEHFKPKELRANYGILRGWHPNPTREVNRLHVGAVIAHLPGAIHALDAHGFRIAYSDEGSAYLVRDPRSGARSFNTRSLF